MNQNLHVNESNFHMKDFALQLALKQRSKAAQKFAYLNNNDNGNWLIILFVVTIVNFFK